MDYSKPFRYISEIAKWQSISLAAEKLNIQQPALSKYLKKVENELGVELFDRSTNPITLTTAGKCYMETANRVIDADNQLHKQISEIQRNNVDIRVGISPSRAPYLLPVIIKSFIKKVPEARVTVLEGTTAELNSGLMRGDLDIIISLLDNETSGFENIELFEESVLLAIPEASAPVNMKEAFSSLDIISSGKGQVMTDLLDIMPEHNSMIECQNMITALSLVKAGVGATLVPSYMADYGDADGVRFIDLPDNLTKSIKRKVCIFYRREQFLSSSEREFIACSKEVTHK